MPTHFCDGLREVSIVNGVARLEFHRLEPVERSQGRDMRVLPEFPVALPVQGFAQALGALDKARERLVREGVFKIGVRPDNSSPAPLPAKNRRIFPDSPQRGRVTTRDGGGWCCPKKSRLEVRW
jgi:hypothetical protein